MKPQPQPKPDLLLSLGLPGFTAKSPRPGTSMMSPGNWHCIFQSWQYGSTYRSITTPGPKSAPWPQ